jgi:hypothetical protein
MTEICRLYCLHTVHFVRKEFCQFMFLAGLRKTNVNFRVYTATRTTEGNLSTVQYVIDTGALGFILDYIMPV